MNIFALSDDPLTAALYHCDKHIVKMPLETAQMLCTTLNQIGIETPYKPCHLKHPCTIWAGTNRDNFLWLCDLGFALSMEYTHRYNKIHKSEEVISFCYKFANAIPAGSLTTFAQAMPDEYKEPCSIRAYRKYYSLAKTHLHKWTNRERPDWM